MPEIKRIPLVSSHLSACGYDESTRTLFIQFVNGATYAFKDTPRAIFDELVNAPSAGKYFASAIKGRYAYDADVFARPPESTPTDGNGDSEQSV